MTFVRSNFAPADGFLVLGHGTTDPPGRVEFLLAAARIAALLEPRPVEAGFLELAEPTIFAAARRVVERGARRVTLLPLLLFAAGHAKRDLPRIAAQLAAEHPAVRFDTAPVLRFQHDLVALSALRFDEAVAAMNAPPVETQLVLVGRGSSDAAATADLSEFARLRQAAPGFSTAVGEVTTCFLAMARPSLDEALELAGGSTAPRVVVQPHLLFPGKLATTVSAAVERMRRLRPAKEWILAEPLGNHPLLAAAALEAAGVSGSARRSTLDLLARPSLAGGEIVNASAAVKLERSS